MSEYIEILGKMKPKNWQNGASFHLADSGDINFEFDGTAVYQPRSLVLYNGNWFVRNDTLPGYNAGILPTDNNFFKPLNPGRDLGHFDTLVDLQTAFPSPNPGSIATYGDETNFVKWNATEGVYDPIKGGSDGFEREFWVNSDIDNPSPPNTFKGPYTLDSVVLPPELDSISFLASLDGDTYTESADITALNTWISTNVTTESTVWQLKVQAAYASGESGEVQIILNFLYS